MNKNSLYAAEAELLRENYSYNTHKILAFLFPELTNCKTLIFNQINQSNQLCQTK